MSQQTRAAAQSNPFSTRFVRPGALAYRFPPGESAATLVERLAASGWRGQIVGPHGSGKSTLVAALGETLPRSPVGPRWSLPCTTASGGCRAAGSAKWSKRRLV